MFNQKDLHRVRQYAPITSTTSSSATPPVITTHQHGICVIDYDVQRYVDTRNLTRKVSYMIQCTLRSTIPNKAAFALPSTTVTEYKDYPIMLSHTISLVDKETQLSEIQLADYAPKTINAAISRSDASENSSGLTIVNSHSSGSADSQTNSYSVGASLGFYGKAVTGDINGSLSHSDTQTTSSSGTFSEDYTSDQQSSHQDTMSIKDWGAYAQLDVGREKPSWIWAQEYPWNVLTYNSPTTGSTSNIQLPAFVQQRMIQNEQVLPPSHLSMLGIDFVAKAAWFVVPTEGMIPNDINVLVDMNYVQGMHKKGSTNKSIAATLTQHTIVPITSGTLDLPLLALGPIKIVNAARKFAVIGFVPNKFDVAPSGSNTFQITSDANDVIVRGQGFNGLLSTDFSAGSVVINVYFKIDESNTDVSLMLKHWCKNTVGAELSIVVNGNTSNPILRQVNVLEGQTGAVRTEEISLRYMDFNSVDYCDLLVMGLNTLTITVTQPTAAGCIYELHALAIG